jgi:hypothetical protein
MLASDAGEGPVKPFASRFYTRRRRVKRGNCAFSRAGKVVAGCPITERTHNQKERTHNQELVQNIAAKSNSDVVNVF